MNIDNSKKCSEGNTVLQSKLWAITDFNSHPVDFNEEDIQYLCYQPEICPDTGRKHFQTFIYFNKKKTLNGVIKFMKENHSKCVIYKPVHIERCRGSFMDNIKYCSKKESRNGEFKEFGEPPKQGQRRDLEDIHKEIKGGKLVDTITEENPVLFHQYGRTMNKLEDIRLRKIWRTEMTTCEWLYGETGIGKSHYAYSNYHPDTHYIYPNDGGWWDAYSGQEIVIINDFRGCIAFNELLQLIDKWPYHVKRRNREPIPFISKHIIITSDISPNLIYFNIDNHRMKQLERRCKFIQMGDIPDDISIEDE